VTKCGGVASWLLPHSLINDVSKINDYAFRGTPHKSFFVLHFATFLLPSLFVIISSHFKLFAPQNLMYYKFIYLHASFAVLILFCFAS